MISWKAIGAGLACQALTQVALFFGIPLFGPEFLLRWTALLTWSVGPLVGGLACGLIRPGRAWICGLISGAIGTAVFTAAVMLRGDWWLVGAAMVIGSILAAAGAIAGRAVVTRATR